MLPWENPPPQPIGILDTVGCQTCCTFPLPLSWEYFQNHRSMQTEFQKRAVHGSCHNTAHGIALSRALWHFGSQQVFFFVVLAKCVRVHKS